MPKEEKQLAQIQSSIKNTYWYRKLIVTMCTFIVVFTGAGAAILVTAELLARYVLNDSLLTYQIRSIFIVCFTMFSLVVSVTGFPAPDSYILSGKEKIAILVRASLLGALGWCFGRSAWVSIQIDGWATLTNWAFEIPSYVFSLVMLTSCALSVTVLFGPIFFTKSKKA